MEVNASVLDYIGNTPLVRLPRMERETKGKLFAKLEFCNPAGSIKDRVALAMIEDAEDRGVLKPNGVIVEATSGNMGIGIVMVANIKGYRTILILPDRVSKEIVEILRRFGANVVISPSNISSEDPMSAYKTAQRIAIEQGAFFADQNKNPINPEAHYCTTGPEIWEQTTGEIDYLVAGIGTGGTISGVGRFLKKKNPEIKVIGVEPRGSIFYNYFYKKEKIVPKPFLVEGIGKDFIPEILDFSVLDDIIQVDDETSFRYAHRLLREEGLWVGGSSGTALAGAIQYSKSLEEEKKGVVIFPDGGSRYLSKVYSQNWLTREGIQINL